MLEVLNDLSASELSPQESWRELRGAVTSGRVRPDRLAKAAKTEPAVTGPGVGVGDRRWEAGLAAKVPRADRRVLSALSLRSSESESVAVWREDTRDIFDQTIAAAAEHLSLPQLAVEKDYWVCQALRAIEEHAPRETIFKGGTSLEKQRLIERFSEDIDLLVIGVYDSRSGGRAGAERHVRRREGRAARQRCGEAQQRRQAGNDAP